MIPSKLLWSTRNSIRNSARLVELLNDKVQIGKFLVFFLKIMPELILRGGRQEIREFSSDSGEVLWSERGWNISRLSALLKHTLLLLAASGRFPLLRLTRTEKLVIFTRRKFFFLCVLRGFKGRKSEQIAIKSAIKFLRQVFFFSRFHQLV